MASVVIVTADPLCPPILTVDIGTQTLTPVGSSANLSEAHSPDTMRSASPSFSAASAAASPWLAKPLAPLRALDAQREALELSVTAGGGPSDTDVEGGSAAASPRSVASTEAGRASACDCRSPPLPWDDSIPGRVAQLHPIAVAPHVAEFFASYVVTQPCPPAVAADLRDQLLRLARDGWCTASGLVFAACLAKRLVDAAAAPPALVDDAGQQQFSNATGALVSRHDCRRVMLALLHLAAKMHDDIFYPLSGMCAAAGVKAGGDALRMLAKCELRVFSALGFSCHVTDNEFEGMCRRLDCAP